MKQGIYEQVINNMTARQLAELDLEKYDIGTDSLDAEEARKFLANYISTVTRKALSIVREQESEDAQVLAQIRICNDIISTLKNCLGPEEADELALDERGRVLTYVYAKLNSTRGMRGLKSEKPARPSTPLSQSSLFTGSHAEPSMMSELKHEILTADRIDFLVSFIKWSGIRLLIDELREFTSHGGQLRILTTTYMEATDYKAIEELSQLPNTQIKISYDTERTRLHAKAYVFHRDTGFTTAYIGSSNISNPALTSGLEWNLKVTEQDSYDVLKRIEATYEGYWNTQEFHQFELHSEHATQRLKTALRKKNAESIGLHFGFEIMPYEYQKEVLDKLAAERTLYNRTKNLIVAATGVGKTVISAFDFKRFLHSQPGAKLLFVAHREEILKQSRDTFRFILKDLNFGQLHVGNHRLQSLDHVFISIQSFQSTKLAENTSADFYDYIIVDEFHHAAAPSYQKLLTHYRPQILLGLTATPERMDEKDILGYFDHTIAAEIRLIDAIDRKLLSPFQYFGVTDNVDLSKVKWSRKGYDMKELEGLYTQDRMRVTQVINSLKKYVTDIDDVKGLGFCVSVDHALYMAKIFNEVGIPALALHGGSKDEERDEAKGRLVRGEIKLIFVVDLYNEGVDIPEVNTILFLRPTESLTVFLQQLGRGLRLVEGKECLTVLDFIGQARKEYNFQEKFQALIGKTRHSVEHYVEHGFFNLPRGSFIQLEKQAQDYILKNLKQASINRSNLINKMKYFASDTGQELTLTNFVQYHRLTLHEFYGNRTSGRTFQGLMAAAGLRDPFEIANGDALIKRIPSLLSLNSRTMLEFLIRYIEAGHRPQNQEERLMLNMFYYTFYRAEPSKLGFGSISEGVEHALFSDVLRNEILDILKYNHAHVDFVSAPNPFPFPCPLDVHCRYSTDQVLAAFGHWDAETAPLFNAGVLYLADKRMDIFFITLNKSKKDFSPSTLYEDYAINESLFHWQTQTRTSVTSPTGQRYIHHRETGSRIALFVREFKEENGIASPFVFLGEAEYVRHEGNKPISCV
ncbi:MAG: NgoFVII family restriction endonuclease, partial [Alicyclobacillus sp. RIFOXYA1_FULL_53_8]